MQGLEVQGTGVWGIPRLFHSLILGSSSSAASALCDSRDGNSLEEAVGRAENSVCVLCQMSPVPPSLLWATSPPWQGRQDLMGFKSCLQMPQGSFWGTQKKNILLEYPWTNSQRRAAMGSSAEATSCPAASGDK